MKRTKYNSSPAPGNWGTWAVIDPNPKYESRFEKTIRDEYRYDEKFAPGKEFNKKMQIKQLSQSESSNTSILTTEHKKSIPKNTELSEHQLSLREKLIVEKIDFKHGRPKIQQTKIDFKCGSHKTKKTKRDKHVQKEFDMEAEILRIRLSILKKCGISEIPK